MDFGTSFNHLLALNPPIMKEKHIIVQMLRVALRNFVEKVWTARNGRNPRYPKLHCI
jgi:hypothetical protein